jgi:hypothetical protein
VSDTLKSSWCVAVLALGVATAQAQTSVREQLTPFLKQHCVGCHSGDSPEGGLDLQANSDDLSNAEVRRRWVYLHDRVAVGEMPPKSEARPNADSKSQFLVTLGDSLSRADLASREIVLRRLNRNEYENTVRDLFGIHVDVKRLLPDDATEQGFDTTASALSLSAEQMVLYVEAADLVLDRVFGPPKKPITMKKTANFATSKRGVDSSERKLSDGVVLFSGAKYLPMYDTSLPATGLYRVRMKIRAEQSKEPVVMHVMGGTTGAIASHTAGFFEALPGKVTTVEFTDRSPERSDCFAFGLVGGFPWWKVNEQEYKGAGLFIGDIEVEGPIEPWPPTSRTELLGDLDLETGTLDDIRAILSRKLPQAFRRVTDDAEVEPFVALAKQALDEGLSFEAALRRGLKGVICAPELLFLEEKSLGSPSQATIDDYALASRLSYFLWSSLPDEQLLSLADRGELQKPEVLRAQIERMLADPKSDRFVESFTGQWLRLYDLDFTVPDRNLYPEYGQLLRQSMLDETHAFFREVLDRDHSVNDFIDSDFAMLNKPLADFYGIDGVKGLAVRRVDLPEDSVRGGVLTQASVLKVSADGTRTSPVLRGAWILKYLYGTPSPPPPPTIAAIEPDIRGATTIREQLAKHREHESCNRCHQKIDPPGFALESFDVIGAQRDWYRTRGKGKYVKVPRHAQAPKHYVQYRQGADVDASGTMPDGRKFANIRDYKRLLLEDKTAMPRSLARLLLTYALGRQLGFSDRPEVERIVASVKPKDYGLRSLIHEIVLSDTFRQP